MAIPELLKDLLTATGPSGYEGDPARVWRSAAESFATSVESDTMGNSFARVAGTDDAGVRVAVLGHIDEIGLIVTHVDDDGFLFFTQVGGWDPQILVGQRVAVHTRDGVVPGVCGRKPIHLLGEEERKKVPRLKDLHIDIGAQDGDEARAKVRVGDIAVVAAEPVELLGGRIVSKSMDNRLGAYVALEAARLVAEAGGAPGEFVAVAAVQEEIGLNGAGPSVHTVAPGMVIATDVSHATDAPGIDVKQEGTHPQGSGPIIERGSIIHPAVFEHLHATAEAEGIPFTVAASGGRTGTDADAAHARNGGYPTGLISFPLRYMHSPVETIKLEDVDNAAKLIAAAALGLQAGTSFLR